MPSRLQKSKLHVPYFRLARLIAYLEKIFEYYGDGSISNPTKNAFLSHNLLGFKGPESGHYHNVVASLHDYGLFEGHGSVKISELGKQILTSRGDAFSEAYRNSALQIPLWNGLYKKFNTLKLREVDEKALISGLMEITGCSTAEAEEHQASIVKKFDEDASPIRAIGSPKAIRIRAGNNPEITWPFTERARKRAISWLKKVHIPK